MESVKESKRIASVWKVNVGYLYIILRFLICDCIA